MTSRFLTLLGWKHAMKGDKGVPFQQVFTVLGAELNLSDLSSGKILVSNKPGRLERMGKLVQRAKGHFLEDGIKIVLSDGCRTLS